MIAADRNRALVRDTFVAWAAGRGTFFDLLADDAIWRIPGSTEGAGQWHGRQVYLDAVVAPLFARLAAPAAPELVGIWAHGDDVIVRWRQETALKSGGTYRNDYAWFVTMRDGKATGVTAFLDLAAYLAAVREDT